LTTKAALPEAITGRLPGAEDAVAEGMDLLGGPDAVDVAGEARVGSMATYYLAGPKGLVLGEPTKRAFRGASWKNTFVPAGEVQRIYVHDHYGGGALLALMYDEDPDSLVRAFFVQDGGDLEGQSNEEQAAALGLCLDARVFVNA
jgi:hypothetical protein